jgi:ABC-type branched-subunit amino acid transport system substrate-binding protein
MQKAFLFGTRPVITLSVKLPAREASKMSFYYRVLLYGTRRTFARSIAMWGCVGLMTAVASAQAPGASLRIGVVIPRAPSSMAEKSSLEGVRLGAAEAKQTARLFGNDVEIFEVVAVRGTGGALHAASVLSSGRKVQILIGVSAPDADNLSRFAEQHRMIFLNVVSRDDLLRRACRRYTFHVEADEAMYANARRLFGTRSGGTRTASPMRSDSVVLWDQRLERFGASQLNDRYRVAAKSGMDGNAWAGWAAVKTVSEAALRSGSGNPDRILAYLEASSTQLDGHKGWPLSFRPTDHQLRQPLYIVVPAGAGTGLIDAPDLRLLSASPGRSANEVLDELASGAGLHCRWNQQ